VLKQASQLHHRGRSIAPKNVGKPTSYTAHKANELWSWDITYLASTIKGQFYYLYLFEDIFSRKVVDWYNTKHRHSKINSVTPSQRHTGEEKEILESRELGLEKAKEMNPLRWSGEVRSCQPAGPVSLNTEK
jgi:transposase InsO family protein